MNKLIKEAKKVGSARAYRSEDEIELAIAWLRGEVRPLGIKKVLKVRQNNVYSWLAVTVKKAFELGYLKEQELEE